MTVTLTVGRAHLEITLGHTSEPAKAAVHLGQDTVDTMRPAAGLSAEMLRRMFAASRGRRTRRPR